MSSRHSNLPLLESYYQRVLELARSTQSPLLADGLDWLTKQPVNWTYPDGHQVPMSNFASQQNFLRGLVALSIVTKDARYQEQADKITHYFLNHYSDAQSGLFHWGGHRFVHLTKGNIEGPASKECVHELKHHFPFYDQLHRIDGPLTEQFLTGFWAAHVLDWDCLDLSRHGQYGKAVIGNPFDTHRPHAVVDPKRWPELPETIGLTFVNASTDLIYAACHYYRYTGDKQALVWAKHLYHQFVLARPPKTGMPVYQFSSPKQREPIPEDDNLTFSWFGDRAKRQFGPEFGDIAREANVLFRDSWPVVVDNPLAILECARIAQDPELAQWAIDGITAYFAHAWDEEQNEIIPMWNTGLDMTGYQFQRDGYYGKKGTVLQRTPTDPAYLLTLVRASHQSDDPKLRELTSAMLKRFGLGTLDPQTLQVSDVATETSLASAYLLLALIELALPHQDQQLLYLCDRVADNLIKAHYHDGAFRPSASHRFVRLDDPVPYALLALEAAHLQCYSQLPVAISKGGYLHGEVQIHHEIKTVYDYDVIYNRTDSEPA